jgi:hypothetical protein
MICAGKVYRKLPQHLGDANPPEVSLSPIDAEFERSRMFPINDPQDLLGSWAQ